MEKEQKKPKDCAIDGASVAILEKAFQENIPVSFTRLNQQGAQCGFGKSGVCCRMCQMGPCRITPKSRTGVCGADADTIVARNFLRQVAAGCAAHSDHARHLVLLLKDISKGMAGNYAIKDTAALHRIAKKYEVEIDGKSDVEVASALSDKLIKEFTSQENALKTITFAPQKRQQVWKKQKVNPIGIDRMIVEALHRTHIGVDHDYSHILMHAFRTALADGWGGSRIATQVSDIIFGTPMPVRSKANLGVLSERMVNVVVHGHEPALSEMLAAAASDPYILQAAKEVGAEGINLAGICCTANEILMRHGIPLAGNFLQQELVLITGVVEAIIIDVQCCMPSLPEVASLYHTEIISTSEIAHTIGALPLEFDVQNAYESAKNILLRAIKNFKNRDPKKVFIPKESKPLVAGFSVEAIRYMLCGTFRASFRPLNDAIIQGRIRGVAGIVGCNNPKYKMDDYINTLTLELIKRNVLVLKTGCAAIASAKAGHLTPEIALTCAGDGLREVCEAVGMPPVLHMGSCVDNSRILEAATEIIMEGGLGDDLSMLPAVGIAPEWMSEKAIAIAMYFVASGIDVVLGHPFYISGSSNVMNFLQEKVRDIFGAAFYVCDDPYEAADRIMEILERRRNALGINQRIERKLFDMKDRRQLSV